jgi:hypothetical protein
MQRGTLNRGGGGLPLRMDRAYLVQVQRDLYHMAIDVY